MNERENFLRIGKKYTVGLLLDFLGGESENI